MGPLNSEELQALDNVISAYGTTLQIFANARTIIATMREHQAFIGAQIAILEEAMLTSEDEKGVRTILNLLETISNVNHRRRGKER